ncbi:MAG TPA: pyridoxamine 5'-phosphate oxidase family protein [Candidatus Bathyarchaeia archaeon]|nr:pyridoxamine 5'-phosphate oxidase family protein [Candidatus Bathyarchaeia archaeon]
MKILNADPAFGRPLTQSQIHDFLSNSKLNIHIATIDEKGEPIIHPTWYYFDVTKNKIYIETAKRSKKVENLNRNSLIYYCVDVPYLPYKGVRGKGKVRIYEDIDHNIPIAEQIMVRYLGSLAHPIAISVMDTVRDGGSVILEITPSFYSTWDES